MKIKEADIDDLSLLSQAGNTFYKEAGLPGTFIPEVFIMTWTKLLMDKVGVILYSEKENKPAGAIGGIIYPDPNDGRLIAMEMFWFVHPEYRGAKNGVFLYKAFEEWAKNQKAEKLIMVALEGPYSSVGDFYLNQGFKILETQYIKEI